MLDADGPGQLVGYWYQQGPNLVRLLLTNTTGTNHGGWAFAFRATAADGTELLPQPP
jgi:hypothetical protein